jgi:hypothetical protein
MKVAAISGGFTIVETLIVLAVVGVLTISTITMISGRVAINRQNDALFQLESGLRAAFNDVANGKFQNTNYTCTQNPGSLTVTPTGVATFGTGGNASYNCVYAGKKFSFNSNNYTIDTVITNETMPFRSNTTVTPSSATQKVMYPNSMTLKKVMYPDLTKLAAANQNFFVVNTNFTYSGNSSGQQNIIFAKTYATAANPTIQGLISGIRVCLLDGTYTKASLYIGLDGTLSTSTNESSC